MVTPCSVTCENVRIVVIARDEKTAPPIRARLQKGHCICIRKNILPLKVSSSYSLSSLPSVTWLMLVFLLRFDLFELFLTLLFASGSYM